MTKDFKFNLDDIVYFIGEGKIYQAKICEVRFVTRFEQTNSGNCGKYNSYKQVLYEVYRLYTHHKNGDTTNTNATHKYCDGEYCETTWFTVDELFESVEDALIHLRTHVEMLPKEQTLDITNINNPF